MKNRKNIKVSVNMFDDTKLKIIDAKPERDLIHYIWFRMMTLAGKVNRDGELYLSKNIPYTVDTLAIEFNRSVKDIEIAVNVLIELEMMGFRKNNVFTVINFSKHQDSRKKQISIKNEENGDETISIKNDSNYESKEIEKINDCVDCEKTNSTNKVEKIICIEKDKKMNDTELAEESHKDHNNKIKSDGITRNNPLRRNIDEKNNEQEQSNIDNLNEYITKKSTSKSRRTQKKKRSDNNIKCVNSSIDSDEEFIRFYDEEIPRIDGEMIKSWSFDD